MSTTSSPSSSTSASNSECSDPPSSRRRRIAKMSQERRERKATLAKLQRIVPYAHEGLSQLELLQRIIDYIADLQAQVERFNVDDNENKENLKPPNTQIMNYPNRSPTFIIRGGRTLKSESQQLSFTNPS